MNDLTRQIGAIAVSVVVTLGFFITLGLLITRAVNPSPLLDGVIGALTVAFGNVVYFWTGSTSGSQQKDQRIAEIIQRSAPPSS
jgi:predicted permease